MVSPETLQGYPFFAGLSDEELQRIAAITEEKTYGPNTYIGYEGNPAEKLYIVVIGPVEVQINTATKACNEKPSSCGMQARCVAGPPW